MLPCLRRDLDVGVAEIRQGDSQAGGNHRLGEMEPAHAAGRDHATMGVGVALLAHGRRAGDQLGQLGLRSAPQVQAACPR